MVPVLIASNTPFTGKVFVALGLAMNLKKQGYKIGFMKPFGKLPVKKGKEVFDEDALFIKEALELAEPLSVISPFVFDYEMQTSLLEGKIGDVKKKIKDAFDTMKDKDFVIIGGPYDLFEGALMNISVLNLIEEMKARVLMVEQWRGPISMDSLFGAFQLMKENFMGAVINKIPENQLTHVKEAVKSFLESKGIKVFAVYKKDKLMDSVTIRRITEAVNGGVICCEDKLDDLVENFLIGAMDVDSAMSYFMRTPNKAVITGANRTDIQLAAMETSTKCIVLTGGLYPNEMVIGKAQSKGIPLIFAPSDTLTTVEKIESIMGRAMIREKDKVERARELIETGFDVKRFLESVG